MNIMETFRNALSLPNEKPNPATQNPDGSLKDNTNKGNQNENQKVDAQGKPIVEGQATDANGKPITPGQENNPANFKSPLDLYGKMFDTKDDSQKEVPPRFALDPKLIGEAAKTLSFSQKHLTTEVRDKIKAGDMDALAGVLDSVGRDAYSVALQHSSVLTDKFVEASLAHSQTKLGAGVRSELLKNSLTKDLPTDNPVVANGLKMISQNLATAFPDASPDWIAGKSREFFVEMAKAITPAKAGSKESTDGGASGDFDWAKWAGEGSSSLSNG